MIRLDLTRIKKPDDRITRKAADARQTLIKGSGAGNGLRGWLRLPSSTTRSEIDTIAKCAERLRRLAEIVVVIGIGGSYLGAKAVQQALSERFGWLKKEREHPHIIYAGINLSEDYTAELLDLLSEYSFAVIAVSKSGTTTEPAIAFRLLRRELEQRYGKEGARERTVVITDGERGALRHQALLEGYEAFAIADDIGGRYSVFSPVGLVPLAVAGIDIGTLLEGARAMETELMEDCGPADNKAVLYAAARNELYGMGYKTEILAVFEPSLTGICEWWKQLYGESEGKENKGIFPASVVYTADLHSLGQYIQEGERNIFETFLSVEHSRREVRMKKEEYDGDDLNYLAGKRLGEINRMAEKGAALAHTEGGMPNIGISIDRIDAFNIGELLYFFEFACGVSGYMLGVNPFNQPGVEKYKHNMFALLDKPGYESDSLIIKTKTGGK